MGSLIWESFTNTAVAACRRMSARPQRLYKLSADQGNATAQTNLGFLYNQGRGVPQDYTAAVGWYRKAAELLNVIWALCTPTAMACRRTSARRRVCTSSPPIKETPGRRSNSAPFTSTAVAAC